MEEFKKSILKRTRLIKLAVLILLVLNICLYMFEGNMPNSEYGISFQLGITIGAELIGIIFVIKYEKVLKDELQLRQLYIQETDERKRMIKQKMSQSTIVASAICLMVAATVAAYINTTVAMTLICVIYGILIIGVLFKVYYFKKY